MNTIRLDIPIYINDATQGESAKLWLAIKKIADEYNNSVNSGIDYDNLSERLINVLSDISQNTSRIAELESAVADLKAKIEALG